MAPNTGSMTICGVATGGIVIDRRWAMACRGACVAHPTNRRALQCGAAKAMPTDAARCRFSDLASNNPLAKESLLY